MVDREIMIRKDLSCDAVHEDERLEEVEKRDVCNPQDIEEQKQTVENFIVECRNRTDKLSKDIKFMKEKFKEMAKLLEEIAEEVLELKYFNTKLQNKDEVMNTPLAFLPPPISKNGHLIWGMDNFKAKMDSATNEQKVYVSQTFLTREFGYKFQVAAYLNGMGQWENKCMLFSIELCPTSWDVLLSWPCRVKITLTLVDQTKERSTAKDETKQFKKVVLNKNVSFFRTFLPKSLLKENDYLSRDSILIVISVSEEQGNSISKMLSVNGSN